MTSRDERLDAALVVLEHLDDLDAALELHAGGPSPTVTRQPCPPNVTHSPSVNFMMIG